MHVIEEARLHEISLVPEPLHPDWVITEVKYE